MFATWGVATVTVRLGLAVGEALLASWAKVAPLQTMPKPKAQLAQRRTPTFAQRPNFFMTLLDSLLVVDGTWLTAACCAVQQV
jgi:hypothetical protein